ncbi:MAG: CoA-transferase [Chloroflexota bacterium]|nr:CoA-transferase [Chloroflexota bacterium]
MRQASAQEIAEQMIACLARLLRNGEIVFHGVASPIPMVATLLAKRTHAPDLVYVSIAGGVDPEPSQVRASTVDPVLLEGARSQVTLTDLFDLAASGRLDTAFLSGVQIDGMGRTNMSVIGEFDRPKVRLPGGAGSAAIMPRAKRTLIWRTRHDPRVFVDRLDFVTATGNVDRVVTPLCVFRRVDGTLRVESVHTWVEPEEVRAMTGFEAGLGDDVQQTPPVTVEERAAIAEIDPDRVALTEL